MNNDDCVVKFSISERAICLAFSEYMNFKWRTCREGIKFKFPKQFGCTVPRKLILSSLFSNFAKNFQMKFSNIVHCELLHAPWNISKKWQHSIIWGPNREEQLLHSGVISFLRLRLANQFSCPCFTKAKLFQEATFFVIIFTYLFKVIIQVQNFLEHSKG